MLAPLRSAANLAVMVPIVLPPNTPAPNPASLAISRVKMAANPLIQAKRNAVALKRVVKAQQTTANVSKTHAAVLRNLKGRGTPQAANVKPNKKRADARFLFLPKSA